MPKRRYIDRKFSPSSLATIEAANRIIAEYQAAGYELTLRQLYYQFVSRDLIANKLTEYKRLGSIINDARLAGLIDWLAIVDRTRELRNLSHWENPAKETDSRFAGYIQTYGDESWELDALEPDVLAGLVRAQVVALRDQKAWAVAETREQEQKDLLQAVSDRWESVADFVKEEE